jgi:predicted pyridoxine 5'-phosphate oxidase superfamily flavin-nucleotide-binding protein
MSQDSPFHSGEQQAQARWNSSDIWDEARKQRLLWNAIPEQFHARLESAPFFFLATSDDQGNCDCSFKGGGPGLVRILDGAHFAFPDYSGNGAFMSLGNILVNPRVGCLFIDFTDGARLRVNGRAQILEGDAAHDLFSDAERVVLVSIERVVPNCSAHIPRLQFSQESPAGEKHEPV